MRSTEWETKLLSKKRIFKKTMVVVEEYDKDLKYSLSALIIQL